MTKQEVIPSEDATKEDALNFFRNHCILCKSSNECCYCEIGVAIECIEKCEQFEYVTRLNRQYIDRVKNSGLGRNKAIEYIEKHFVESTRSLIDWSDDE